MHHGVATGGIWLDTYSVQLQKILSYNLYYKIIFCIGNFMVKINKQKMHFLSQKRLFHTKLMKQTLFKLCLKKNDDRKTCRGES